MSHVEKYLDVNVPLHTAYNQWTQFEEFPKFMEGVREVRQLDNRRLHWRATIAGKDVEWDAEITEQIPDQKVAWRNIDGQPNAGIVTFQPTGPECTRVTLQMDYGTDSLVAAVADKLGFITHRVEGDLERFKEFIETRGVETGAWRGQIAGPAAASSAADASVAPPLVAADAAGGADYAGPHFAGPSPVGVSADAPSFAGAPAQGAPAAAMASTAGTAVPAGLAGLSTTQQSAAAPEAQGEDVPAAERRGEEAVAEDIGFTDLSPAHPGFGNMGVTGPASIGMNFASAGLPRSELAGSPASVEEVEQSGTKAEAE